MLVCVCLCFTQHSPESTQFVLCKHTLMCTQTFRHVYSTRLRAFSCFLLLCFDVHRYGCVRLDGSMSIKKRAKIVDHFNDPTVSKIDRLARKNVIGFSKFLTDSGFRVHVEQ